MELFRANDKSNVIPKPIKVISRNKAKFSEEIKKRINIVKNNKKIRQVITSKFCINL